MFFETKDMAINVARTVGFKEQDLLAAARPEYRAPSLLHIMFETTPHRLQAFASAVVGWLGDPDWCRLWITEFGVWPSNENLHLYYRLRQSYGDYRPLHDAPCHSFLPYERADLVTFVGLAMQFGWGAHILTERKDIRGVLSHDGWVRIETPALDHNMEQQVMSFGMPYWIGAPA